MKCYTCNKEIGQPGSEGNYVHCARVLTPGEQITIGYIQSEWNICFNCWVAWVALINDKRQLMLREAARQTLKAFEEYE